MVALLPPLLEISEKPLAQHCSNRKPCSELVLGEKCALSINVVLPGISNGHINILLHSDVQSHVFHLLCVLTKTIEAVLQDETVVGLPKLDGCHVCLHQMTVVVDVVFPSLHHRVQGTNSFLLLLSKDESHLIEHLGSKQLLRALDLEDFYSDAVCHQT